MPEQLPWIVYIYLLFKEFYFKNKLQHENKFSAFKLEEHLNKLKRKVFVNDFTIYNFEKVINKLKVEHLSCNEQKCWAVLDKFGIYSNRFIEEITEFDDSNMEVAELKRLFNDLKRKNKKVLQISHKYYFGCLNRYRENREQFKYNLLCLNLCRLEVSNVFSYESNKEVLQDTLEELLILLESNYNIYYRLKILLLIGEVRKELCYLTNTILFFRRIRTPRRIRRTI